MNEITVASGIFLLALAWFTFAIALSNKYKASVTWLMFGVPALVVLLVSLFI